MLRRRAARLAVCAAAVAALAAGRAPAEPGVVRGRVALDLPGTALADVLPVVVYLEALGAALAARPSATPATVHQRHARFVPTFLAVAAGQSVDLPNDDRIYHSVFSYSRPNDFDLGLYPAGQSRAVTFRHPGMVKLYCSIHESMNGTIFVAPSPWFAAVGANGRFEIRGVPPGRYALATWAEKLPTTRREISVASDASPDRVVPLVESAR